MYTEYHNWYTAQYYFTQNQSLRLNEASIRTKELMKPYLYFCGYVFLRRDHNCSHHDHTDGECPVIPATSISHQGFGRVLLDLLCVCFCGAHRVRLRSLQCWLPTQREGQGEGQQAQLWGEAIIPIMYSHQQTTMPGCRGVLWVMSRPFKHRPGLSFKLQCWQEFILLTFNKTMNISL